MSRAPALAHATRSAVLLACLSCTSEAFAGRAPIDRVVVRFTAAELGGIRGPRFITERSLAFQARLEALADEGKRKSGGVAFKPRHVRAALERHVAETVLAAREIDPPPQARVVAIEELRAERLLVERAGGAQRFTAAMRAEGMSSGEVALIVRRRARASLYLDRMVMPMLEPSDAELRAVFESTQTPFRGRPFSQILTPLRSWYVARRLTLALQSFFESMRDLVRIAIVNARGPNTLTTSR